jgi:hypothetical protein
MFESIPLNYEATWKADAIRHAFEDVLDRVYLYVPEGRELSLVRTKLQEACFFAIRGLSLVPDNQRNLPMAINEEPDRRTPTMDPHEPDAIRDFLHSCQGMRDTPQGIKEAE